MFAPILRGHPYFPGAHLSPPAAGRAARLPPPTVQHAVRRERAHHPEGARLVNCLRALRSILPPLDAALRPEVAVVFPPIDACPVMTVLLNFTDIYTLIKMAPIYVSRGFGFFCTLIFKVNEHMRPLKREPNYLHTNLLQAFFSAIIRSQSLDAEPAVSARKATCFLRCRISATLYL